MRQDIYNLFNVYQPEFQYKWNRIIAAGFDSFAEELKRLSDDFHVRQTVEGEYVFWTGNDEKIEAMFAYLVDPTDLDAIIQCYSLIRDRQIHLTFAIIEQREDGSGMYDIFRLSETSYLEHMNRAYPQGTSPD